MTTVMLFFCVDNYAVSGVLFLFFTTDLSWSIDAVTRWEFAVAVDVLNK